MSENKSKRRRRRKKTKHLDALRKKLKQGSYKNYKLIPGSDDSVNMSEVLREFINPYVDHTDTEESYRMLIIIAILAWNASFLPEKEQREMVDRVFNKELPTDVKVLKSGLRDIVYQLIARKQIYFPEYGRKIIDFEVVDLGDRYHLSVASTPDDDHQKENESDRSISK